MNLTRNLLTALVVFLTVGVYFPLHTLAQSSDSAISLDLTNPNSCLVLNEGTYSNPEFRLGQIAVIGRGAVVCSWSLSGADLSHSRRIRLSFEMLTNVITPGPFGPRVTATVGLATFAPTRIDPDTSAIFPLNTKDSTTTVDCCFLGPFLQYQSDLWINPDAPSSGDRVTHVFSQVFTGYADDNVFHSFSIDVDMHSQTTTWSADGGAATATGSNFTFVPAQLFFYARASDAGNSMVTQIRNVEIRPPPVPA